MSQPPPLQYWWVNHKRTPGQRLVGAYLWSAQGRRNSNLNESSRNMARVQPGDLMWLHTDRAVRAIGIALAGATLTDRGWQLPARFMELDVPLQPAAHASALAAVLPQKHSPLSASGACIPGVYLASIPDSMAAVLRDLLAGQVEDIEFRLTDSADSELADEWAEQVIQQRTDLTAAQKLQLIRARRGQGDYRKSLEQHEYACRLSGLLDRRHLRARHIKPWSISSDPEKLDGCNGLLFSPQFDHLFARGYIAFSDNGELLVSRHLNPAVLQSWKVTPPINVGAFKPQQCVYLEQHRREVFEQPQNGRRGE
jgi:putative restriction endonuclease